MASEIILYGNESLPYTENTAALSPAPIGSLDGAVSGTPLQPLLSNIIAQRFARSLGTQLVMQDGKKFRYGNAGGVTLVVGNVISSAAVISTDVDMTPLTGTFPPHRLGPTGDVAKVSCTTCHQGAFKPLYGAQMAKDFPELQVLAKK